MSADRLSTMVLAAQKAGEICLSRMGSVESKDIIAKGCADFVSEVDMDAEREIRRVLNNAFPEDAIVGEEFGGSQEKNFWSIDPLDGTSNFLSGLPLWGVSIAWVEQQGPVLGAVVMPALGVALFGGIDSGLHSIGSHGRTNAAEPVMVGVGRNRRWSMDDRISYEQKIEQTNFTVVSLGSCSVSLAYVAMGRLAGYIEHHVNMWDCAAGHALCLAAGMYSTIVPLADGRVAVAAARSRDLHEVLV